MAASIATAANTAGDRIRALVAERDITRELRSPYREAMEDIRDRPEAADGVHPDSVDRFIRRLEALPVIVVRPEEVPAGHYRVHGTVVEVVRPTTGPDASRVLVMAPNHTGYMVAMPSLDAAEALSVIAIGPVRVTV